MPFSSKRLVNSISFIILGGYDIILYDMLYDIKYTLCNDNSSMLKLNVVYE